jgi:hypothetical protein
MAESFPREALDFAWRDHPEYIRYLRRGTTTVEAPQARFQPPTGVASSVATAHAINAATTTTTAPAISSIVPDADDIDPDAEAALAQLQMGMKSAAAASAPFGNKPQTADIVAEARAKAQAALQAARRNG